MKNKNLYNAFKDFLKKSSRAGVATSLLLTSGFAVEAQNGFTQNPVWLFGGKKISFTNGDFQSPTVLSEANYPHAAFGAHNSYSDAAGNVLFYMSGGNPQVYRANGTYVGTVPGGSFSNAYNREIVFVPKPGSCNEVYIIFFTELKTYQAINLVLAYGLLNTTTWQFVAGGSINPPSLSSFGSVYNSNGGLAVSKPDANGNHKLYAIVGDAVYRYDITSQGIQTPNTLNTMNGSAINQVLPYRDWVGNNFYIGNQGSTANEITTKVTEAELSTDGSRLAWGTVNNGSTTGKVAFIKLDQNTGNLPLDQSSCLPIALPNNIKVVDVTNISGGRINGIEFHPTEKDMVYIAAGEDNTTNTKNGISGLDFTNFQAVAQRPSQNTAYSGSYLFAQSFLEMGYNKRLITAGTTNLRNIVINQDKSLSITTIIPGIAAPTFYADGINSGPLVRSLPDQIDGYGYNFTKLIAITGNLWAGQTVKFTVPWVSGAWYDWKYDGVPQSGVLLDFYKTFSSADVGTHTIEVTANTNCGSTTINKQFTVYPCEGCPIGGGGSRMANIAGLTVYNNQELGKLKVNLPNLTGAYEVYITDMKGSLVKKLAFAAGSSQELSTTGFKPGVYILRAVSATGAHTQKFTVNP